MAEHAVFDNYAADYDRACELGLSLTGEDKDYFARRRVEITVTLTNRMGSPNRIIDFGCGIGSSTPYFLDAFPNGTLLGFDPSTESIAQARARFSNPRTAFDCDLGNSYNQTADLVYCNGVFHHIPPQDRDRNLNDIHRCLKPGGLIAFWENNPWNPGTRWVMSRIPFDRDAIPLSVREARLRIKNAGFSIIHTRSHFYFPRMLKAFRGLEPLLSKLPFGGQYCVFAQKPVGNIGETSSSAKLGEGLLP